MTFSASHTADTVDQLQRQLAAAEAENDRLLALMAKKEAQWEAAKAALFEQFRLAIERQFGPSTEKYRVAQGDLLINEAEVAADEEDAADLDVVTDDDADATAEPRQPAKRRSRGGRVALPPELPRVEVVHELPDEARHCRHDGTELKEIGKEISEELHVVPARVEVIRHVRVKYGCPVCEEGVQIAPAPAKLLPKSNASATLLAYVATAKYQDALPLYRQSQIFARHGAEIPRNTLARWMVQTGDRMAPLIEALRRHLLQAPLIHMDETTLQVNTEADRPASSTSYMWLQRGGPPGQQVVLFDYDASRAGRVPIRLLGDYAGRLVTDGYEGYAEVVRQNGITHAGCWAHARRKFVEAQKVQPKGKTGKADWALNQIRKLYAVETQAKTLDPEARQALREQKSRPLITQLRNWLDKSVNQVLPKSALGKALHYLDGQWNRLTRFLDDGLIPLDNNLAENAIRPYVVGRKNWLFSHTPSGAHASAAIYSLIETAKVNGLSPYEYLQFVFETLPMLGEDDDLDCLLPWRWKDTLPN
ncbi:IS66 family transposase [Halomonas campisalis]|uniref:IS66 family transposase n=1 Tax=Billgrantia campisalis TaxID=74661 RepID=A0ABS9PDS6_9GAMM|nr:IS66 family transposase [Halomonas campisalis]MCG6659922.1 IS66 family transposase [Halomonas campisalis]MDR5865133.1 IS66 family transposase [Halomonas campisalis]